MERIPSPKPRRNQDAAYAKLLGQRLSDRDFDRQAAEFQVRVAVLNGFTAPGTPVTEAAGQVCPGKGNSGNLPICATCVTAPSAKGIF